MNMETNLDPEPVEEALRAEACSFEREAPSAWKVVLPAWRPIACRAEFHESWLRVETEPLGPPARGRKSEEIPLDLRIDDWLWMLLRQPEASAGSRPVLVGRNRLVIRGEALLAGPEGLTARVQALLRGVKGVYLSATDKGRGPALPDDLSEPACVRLAALCEEFGCEYTTRSDGRLMAGLDAGGDLYRQAALRPIQSGGVRARVELAALPATASASQGHALARLLLRAAGQVRAVAGAGWTREGGVTVGLEAMLEVPPTAAELACILGALALACRLCGREAEALGDQRISAEYLALQRGFAG